LGTAPVLDPTSDPGDLARRRWPPPPDARPLDLWARGCPHAVPSRRPSPARVAARPNAPHSRLVRLHAGVPPGARRETAGGTWCRSGTHSDGQPPPAVRAARAALTAHANPSGARTGGAVGSGRARARSLAIATLADLRRGGDFSDPEVYGSRVVILPSAPPACPTCGAALAKRPAGTRKVPCAAP